MLVSFVIKKVLLFCSAHCQWQREQHFREACQQGTRRGTREILLLARRPVARAEKAVSIDIAKSSGKQAATAVRPAASTAVNQWQHERPQLDPKQNIVTIGTEVNNNRLQPEAR